MKKHIITISALCYALEQAWLSCTNIFSDHCNDTIEDNFATVKILATEILFELEEANMTSEDATAEVLWYDPVMLERLSQATCIADLNK